MKPLDADKKGSKEVSAPAEAAQAAPVVEEKTRFFPMWRSSRCSRIRWILTPSPRAISVPWRLRNAKPWRSPKKFLKFAFGRRNWRRSGQFWAVFTNIMSRKNWSVRPALQSPICLRERWWVSTPAVCWSQPCITKTVKKSCICWWSILTFRQAQSSIDWPKIVGAYATTYANLLRAYAKNAFGILRLQTSSDSIR